VAGGFSYIFYVVGNLLLLLTVAFVVLEIIILHPAPKKMILERVLPHRLSNGDDNSIFLRVKNKLNFPIDVEIIDEIPHQFQKRDVLFKKKLKRNSEERIEYMLRPTKRGVYHFGNSNVFVSTFIGLISKRVTGKGSNEVAVYPSFLQLKKLDFLAAHEKLWQIGVKKQRRIGNSTEFEQIKNYVSGDDYRKLNWKATARTQKLMVNHFVDERSQNMIAVINMGRIMKMPFNGLSLLDYSINSTLSFLSLALKKSDKVGLITFNNRVRSYIPASKQKKVFTEINEGLYKIQEDFIESDYEGLSFFLSKKVTQRSFIFLYTNFETITSIERALPYLKQIAKRHRLIVTIFKNSVLEKSAHKEVQSDLDMHEVMMVDIFIQEKRDMEQLLLRHGIDCIFCEPEELTVESVNHYLRLKAKGAQ
jgi:uncharacterized protein (DUF58 family)